MLSCVQSLRATIFSKRFAWGLVLISGVCWNNCIFFSTEAVKHVEVPGQCNDAAPPRSLLQQTRKPYESVWLGGEAHANYRKQTPDALVAQARNPPFGSTGAPLPPRMKDMPFATTQSPQPQPPPRPQPPQITNHSLGATKVPPACQGVEMDDRCWYLSKKGDNCRTTCLRQGRAFKYAVADAAHPLVPRLTHAHPRAGMPLLAFECYKPEEERYHSVSSCSANDYRDTSATFSDPDCQLACPCGGVVECSWLQAKECTPVFNFNETTYTGCPTVDKGDPWCQHKENDEDKWSYCEWTCSDASVDAQRLAAETDATADETDATADNTAI